MIRVAALTSGVNVPSSRFRVRQHLSSLKRAGVMVREYSPIISKYAGFPGLPTDTAALKTLLLPVYIFWSGLELALRLRGVLGSWKADLTWLERELFPGCLTWEPFLKRPYVFDVDDSIWIKAPFGRSTMIRIARNAELVLAGNHYIADWFSPYAKNVQIIPTAIDTERFSPRESSEREADRSFVVGWTGQSIGFPYLYSIEACLGEFLQDYDAEFWVMAEQRPRFQKIPAGKVRYFKWSPTTEAEFVRKIDVGIMPLLFSDECRGKCSFKMLQYMSSGVPVVASPVGMNKDILDMGRIGYAVQDGKDWYMALEHLYKDRSLGQQMGDAGRKIAQKFFSRDVISSRLSKIFHELA